MFNTPFGRFRYCRLPFGISSAPEVFCKTVREMFSDLPGVECIVDDILVWGENDCRCPTDAPEVSTDEL